MAAAKRPAGKRQRIEISKRDQKAIVAALERWAETENFVGLRTRAFVYLLWDGALKPKVALSLNAQDVAPDPRVLRITQEVVQGPCEANRYRQLRFFLSRRVREALKDYLHLVRQDGWLPTSRFEGPLFLSSYHHGQGKRVARRTMMVAWKTFLREHTKVTTDYQLEDVIYTGRMAFLRAADGDTSSLSKHSSITQSWAATGYQQRDSETSAKEVLERLNELYEKG